MFTSYYFILMKRLAFSLLALALSIPLLANDSMYYTLGNQLVPLQATDIRLQREVLTITLLNDGFAQVDVFYELNNQGEERTITMGFEADAPYMGEDFSPDGVHPHIKGFNVEINGATLTYHNALVRLGAIDDDGRLVTLNPNQWKEPSGDEDFYDALLYNAALDSTVQYAYAYYFDAHFKKGLNVVRHSYRYRVGVVAGEAFFLDYKLTPALRWKGGQIDDFTLIIRADQTFKHFIVKDTPFGSHPAWTISGIGKQRTRQYSYEAFIREGEGGNDVTETVTEYATEFALRNAEARLHITGFRPAAELDIRSGDTYIYREGEEGMYGIAASYDPGMPGLSQFYYIEQVPIVNGKPLSKQRIQRNLPFAAHGYVFKDKQLAAYFSNIWWYMPDPTYKADVTKLIEKEQEWIYFIDHPDEE